MKRNLAFVRPIGRTTFITKDGHRVALPVAPGLLKHPASDDLGRLLRDPAVALKYTVVALQLAPWSILREFPPAWLRTVMQRTPLKPARRRALEFMLSP
jgi:hypothetical protein